MDNQMMRMGSPVKQAPQMPSQHASPDNRQIGLNPSINLKNPAFGNPNQVSVHDLNQYQN